MFVSPILVPRIPSLHAARNAGTAACNVHRSSLLIASRIPHHHGERCDDGHRHRIRLPRRHTHYDPNWAWHGAPNRSTEVQTWTFTTLHTVEQSMHKMLQVLDKSRQTFTQSTAPFFTRITALGARVLRRVTHVIGRALSADSDPVDLTVEYGIADPCPRDKTFVDPLRDWDPAPSSETCYRDSYGNAVYLQLDGASGIVVASDFRDGFDEYRDDASFIELENSHQYCFVDSRQLNNPSSSSTCIIPSNSGHDGVDPNL